MSKLIKFLTSQELGRLNKWLKILGFDSKIVKEDRFSSVLIEALREKRILLTRKETGKHFGIHIILIKSDNYIKQLRQVLSETEMVIDKEKIFSRCLDCNEELVSSLKDKVKHKVPEFVYKTHQRFKGCPKCKKIYWQGTHWDRVESIIEKIGKKPETRNPSAGSGLLRLEGPWAKSKGR